MTGRWWDRFRPVSETGRSGTVLGTPLPVLWSVEYDTSRVKYVYRMSGTTHLSPTILGRDHIYGDVPFLSVVFYLYVCGTGSPLE